MSSKGEALPLGGSGTFNKLMEVIQRIAEAEAGATFPQLGHSLNLPKSTLHRLLQVLLSHGLVRLDDDRRYLLGYGFFELARLSWDRVDIRREAQQTIVALVRESGETVHLAVLDGTDVVYVDKVEGSHRMRMASMIGVRNPAYCTGVGKALLAYLEPAELQRRFTDYRFHAFTAHTIASLGDLGRHLAEIRQLRYATDDEEHEIGIRCVAAPIFNFRGDTISSISITVPTIRCDHGRLSDLARQVLEAADEITARCGGRLPPR